MLRLKAERRSLAKVSGATAPESRITKTTDIAYCNTQSPGSNTVVSVSREIPLTNGLVTIVDECDYEMLSRFKWQRMPAGCHYVRRSVLRRGKHLTVYMHRMIMLPDPGLTVDHINHDPLDNRRANLRVCTQGQNVAGRLSRKGSSSPFKGVSWNRYRWDANCQGAYLGAFADEEEAALAYDAAARELYGEFAALNFPAVAS